MLVTPNFQVFFDPFSVSGGTPKVFFLVDLSTALCLPAADGRQKEVVHDLFLFAQRM